MFRSLIRGQALWLVAAALLLRLLIPAGMMPGPGGTLVICTGQGAVTVSIDRDGHPEKAPPALPDHAAAPCAYTALTLAGPLAAAATVHGPTLAWDTATPAAWHGVRLGEGLGRPPLPSTGPPLQI